MCGDFMALVEKKLPVKGMHCGSCAKIIEDKLSELQEVKEVKVSYPNEEMKIKFEDSNTAFKEIKGVIADAGYSTGDSAVKNSERGRVSGRSTIKEGIIYGLVPHTGCIAFIAASVLGATVAVEFFKPLLMNPWFFHILVLISFLFATISSAIYLNKNGVLSWDGIKRKKGYLSAMYGVTIGINLLLFLGIFPMLANIEPVNAAPTGAVVLDGAGAAGTAALSEIVLAVQIPCPGHAPLISGELKTLPGVRGVKYGFPNVFTVSYDASITSKENMFALDVFEPYPATIVSESAEGAGVVELQEDEATGTTANGTSGSGGLKSSAPLSQSGASPYAGGSCGGSCGGSSCGGGSCGCGGG